MFKGAAIELEAKAVNETGEFEGYGSVFNSVDRGMDVILPGTFAASLTTRPVERVKMLWQHDPSQPIGKWVEMREDSHGLYCKGKLFLNVQQGREAHELMREGAIDGLSIGYRTKRSEIDRENGVRKLMEAELLEVSVVTFPMMEDARVSLVKASGELPTEREFEDYLRDGGLSSRQAKIVIGHGFKALKTERDAGTGEEGIVEAMHKLAQSLRR